MTPPFPSLPSELWISTFEHLKSSFGPKLRAGARPHFLYPDYLSLKRLSLTSSWFHFLVEPLLHELLVIVNDSPKATYLLHRIEASPHLAAFVKRLIVERNVDGPVDFDRTVASHLLSRLYPKLINVKAVYLLALHISPEFISEIIRLPSLEVWECRDLRLTSDPKSVTFDPRELKLTHIRASFWVGLVLDDEKNMFIHGIQLLAKLALSPTLQILDVYVPSWPQSITEVGLIPHLSHSHKFLSLHTLHTQMPRNPELFYDFARRCPNVVHAKIRAPPSTNIPTDIFPLLKSVDSSSENILSFAIGRPVESIRLTREVWLTRNTGVDAEDIFMHIPDLKTLEASYWRFGPRGLQPIAATLSNLEELKIHRHKPDFLRWPVEELSGMTSLRVLHLTSDPCDRPTPFDEDPQGTLEILQRNHPLLEEAYIEGAFDWLKEFKFELLGDRAPDPPQAPYVPISRIPIDKPRPNQVQSTRPTLAARILRLACLRSR